MLNRFRFPTGLTMRLTPESDWLTHCTDTSMKLIIMRHGQASWSAPKDSLRPLTETGRAEVQRTATQLGAYGLERILASPYLRAQQTAEIVAEHLGLSVETIQHVTPDGSPSRAIEQLPESGNTLIVSHMPLVSGLTELLCSGSPYGGPGFGTACAAVLDCEIPVQGLATFQEMLPL